MKPPYDGQGTPLPQSMGLTGVWVIENLVALTIDESSTPDDDGVFQRAPKSPKGNNIFTVDARVLAKNFELTVEKLFAENQSGRLLVGYTEKPEGNASTLKFFCNGIESSVSFERSTEQ